MVSSRVAAPRSRRPAVCHTSVRRSTARASVSNRIDSTQDHQDGGEHARAVENGAVPRHQIADAGRRGEHLRHHHADDGERAAEPQAGQHGRDRGRDDDAGDLLRQARAHAARGQQELRVDGADAGGGREHHGEEAVDAGKGDLRFRADAEPGGEDRIEDDDRHGVEAGEDRQQQVAQQRQAADQRADQDAGAAGDQHRQRDLVERHQQGWRIFVPVAAQHGQRLRQRRQEQLGHQAGRAAPAPRARGGAPGSASGRWRARVVASQASRRLADLLPDAVAQAAEYVGRHHLVGARPRQRDRRCGR